MKAFYRNFFSCVLCALACVLSVTGCYDDSDVWGKLNEHESRIVKLEILTEEYNANLSSLQGVLNALNERDYVTDVLPVNRNGKEVGLTIIFSKKSPITIFFGEVSIGNLGGAFPEIGVGKDVDGNYYWTLDGIWITDDEGNKILASGQAGQQGAAGQNGVTPKLKIENDKWYVSYDNEKTWNLLGDVPSGGSSVSGGSNQPVGGCVFSDVKVGENSVALTLTDGTEVVVPKKFKVNFVVGNPECTHVEITGVAMPVSPDYEVGVYYSKDSRVQVQASEKVSCFDFGRDNSFSICLDGLEPGTTYYWRSYVSMYGDVEYGEVQSFTTPQLKNLPVSEIKMVRRTIYNEVMYATYRYTYDEQFRITCMEFKVENWDVNHQLEDRWIVNAVISYDNAGQIDIQMISGNGADESYPDLATAYLDDSGRVTRIVKSEDGSETMIEYYPDGLQKKVVFTENWGLKSTEYSYHEGAMTGVKSMYSGNGVEDLNEYTLDPSVVCPDRLPVTDGMVNINMLLAWAEFGNAYEVLSHIGYCGRLYGNYLFQKTDSMSSVKVDSYLGETGDKNFRQHVKTVDYVSRSGDMIDVDYVLSLTQIQPVSFSAQAVYEQYRVEYDLVAGNKTEYSDPDYPTYEIIKEAEQRDFVGEAYDQMIWKITCLGVNNGNEGSNESVGENDGEWAQ